MSERAILAEWRNALRDSRLDTTAKAVGFVIATYWSSSGRNAFPNKETIAKGATVSKRTADTAIDRLEAAGFLDVSRSRGGSSNRYLATIPTLQPAAGSTVQPAAGSNGATDDIQPCSPRHRTLQPTAPESGKAKAKELMRTARAGARDTFSAVSAEELGGYDRAGL